MNFLRHLPIKRKLMVITMLVSAAALVIASVSFIVFEQSTARKQMVRALEITAGMTAANSTAGLSFDEAGSVEQALASLNAQPDIVQACVYNKNGRQFAQYHRDTGKYITLPPPMESSGSRFENHRLKLFYPVNLAGETIGTVYLEEDLSQLTTRLWSGSVIAAAVLLVCGAVAFFLSVWLQNFISAPLSALAETVAVVRANKNYSVRAIKQGDDELGHLIDGFNEMLAQIQERDTNLERRVAERTRKLAESEANYSSLVDQMPAGVFRKDKEGRYVFVNSWFCRFKNARPEDYLGKLPHEVADRQPGDGGETESETAILTTAAILHHAQILQTGRQIEYEEKKTSDDGQVNYFHAVKSGVYGPDGNLTGSQGILLDVTQRKLVEAELAYERDLLKALLDQSPDSIYFKDRQSRFVRLSRSELLNLFQVALMNHDRSAALPEHLTSMDRFQEYVIGKSDADFYAPELAARFGLDEQQVIRTGKPMVGKVEQIAGLDGQVTWLLTTKSPWYNKNGEIIGTFGTSRNITDLKAAEAKVGEAHQKLLETSRLAGMAEVATSVLHNVGNVLNSVNVSTTLVLDLVKKSRLNSLGRLAAMVHENRHNLAAFFTTDPRGSQLPAYLIKLAEHIAAEQAQLTAEIELTRKNVEHIKDIVTMQQSYAKVSGVVEKARVTDLVEDALRMNAGALTRHGVKLFRDFPGEIIEGHFERQKVLQILVNLIRNAKYACDESGRADKRLTMLVRVAGGRVQIIALDNGVGIPAENLTRIFNHGFTTRQHGHGFGLHSGALAAREMGGSLTAASDGPGAGARFVLDLPLQPLPSPAFT